MTRPRVVVGQRQVQADDVGRGEQLVEAEPADAVLRRRSRRRRSGRRRRPSCRRRGRARPPPGRSGPGRPGPGSCRGPGRRAGGPSRRRGSSGRWTTMFRHRASRRAKVCSATLSWLVPGVIVDGDLVRGGGRDVDRGRSRRPVRAMTRSRGAIANSSGVIRSPPASMASVWGRNSRSCSSCECQVLRRDRSARSRPR